MDLIKEGVASGAVSKTAMSKKLPLGGDHIYPVYRVRLDWLFGRRPGQYSAMAVQLSGPLHRRAVFIDNADCRQRLVLGHAGGAVPGAQNGQALGADRIQYPEYRLYFNDLSRA